MTTEPGKSGERQSEILDEAVRKFGAYVESTGSGVSYVVRLTRALIEADISLEIMQGAFGEVQKMALEGASVESTPEEKCPTCGGANRYDRYRLASMYGRPKLPCPDPWHSSPVPLAERPQTQLRPTKVQWTGANVDEVLDIIGTLASARRSQNSYDSDHHNTLLIEGHNISLTLKRKQWISCAGDALTVSDSDVAAERPLCGFDMGGGLKCNEPSGHKPQHKYTDRTERSGSAREFIGKWISGNVADKRNIMSNPKFRRSDVEEIAEAYASQQVSGLRAALELCRTLRHESVCASWSRPNQPGNQPCNCVLAEVEKALAASPAGRTEDGK